MELAILIVVCLLVIVQVVGLCWRMKMGGRVEGKHFEHFDRILKAQDVMMRVLIKFRVLGKCKECGLQFVTTKLHGTYDESACCVCELQEKKDSEARP